MVCRSQPNQYPKTQSPYINIDSVKVNSVLSIDEFYKKIIKHFTVDSIIDAYKIYDCPNADSLLFIGESIYSYHAGGGNCQLSRIVFDDKIKFITINSFQADTTTTIDEFINHFKIDKKEIYKTSIHRAEQDCSTIRFQLYFSAVLLDWELILFFKNNKLFRVDLWDPI